MPFFFGLTGKVLSVHGMNSAAPKDILTVTASLLLLMSGIALPRDALDV